MASSSVNDVGTSDPAWLHALENVEHDVYQLPEYVAVSALADGGEGRALIANSQKGHLILPYIRRSISSEMWDAVSPYGYPGPVASSTLDDAELRGLMVDALRHLEANKCVSVFLRSHPGFNTTWPNLHVGHEKRRISTPTVVIELAQPANELWHQTISGHRNEINRARRRGYTAEPDPDFERYEQFIDLYRHSMRSIGAEEYFLFSDEYFNQLRTQLGKGLVLVVALLNGELAAGALFTLRGQWVQYHLSATDSRHRSSSPSKLIIDSMRAWSKANGFRWLHLGGGRGGHRDSLLTFKAGFSQKLLTFNATGLILNSAVYARLTALSANDPAHDYFPAYRKPPAPTGNDDK